MNYLCAVDSHFYDYPGGTARVAWDISLMMREQGHDVTMFCKKPENGAIQTHQSEKEGIRILYYQVPKSSRWNIFSGAHQIKAAFQAANEWLTETFWDVVHIHSLFTGTAVMKALTNIRSCVYTVHSPVVPEQKINWAHQGLIGRIKLCFGLNILRRYENRLLQKASAVHTLSEFTESQVHKFHGFENKTTVIPHWVRPEYKRSKTKQQARQVLQWPQNIPVLFTLRNCIPRTGLDIALKAVIPLALQNKCLFVIAGDGPLRKKLQQQAEKAGANPAQILFTGRLSDEKLMLAYQAADLFVLPTVGLECFGLIIQESLAMDCPVVATDIGAIPEILKQILPEFIVPAGNATILRTKIQDYLQGKLKVPSQNSLSEYVQRRYAKKIIYPKIVNLLTAHNKQ